MAKKKSPKNETAKFQAPKSQKRKGLSKEARQARKMLRHQKRLARFALRRARKPTSGKNKRYARREAAGLHESIYVNVNN